MADTVKDETKVSRRRSMLPQLTERTAVLPNASQLKPLAEEHESQIYNVPLSAVALTNSRYTSLGGQRPYDSAINSRRTLAPPRPSSDRRYNTAQQVGGDVCKVSVRPRANSGTNSIPRFAKPASHGRSMSQQVEHSSRTSVPSRSPSQRHATAQYRKPAFSTMQQHFTPKKAPSPLESASSMNPQVGFELITGPLLQIQTELAQLHLMHRSAGTGQHDWENSAKRKYELRFIDLCAKNSEIKEIAHQQQACINQLALVEWCQGVPSVQVAERVQQLSRNLVDTYALLDSDGKFTRVLAVFHSWFTQAKRVQDSRNNGMAKSISHDLAFLEGIGDGWKAEAMVLERELSYSSRELKALGDTRKESSLGRILILYKNLVQRLLDELDVIQWIESEIMGQETGWKAQMIDKLSSKIDHGIRS